jgi:hypothetical protein
VPDVALPAFSYIDSDTCSIYKDSGGHFFVVIYSQPCPSGHDLCKSNWGFFEVVDKSLLPNGLIQLKSLMQSKNGNTPLTVNETSLGGTYATISGPTIVFDALGHVSNSSSTGIMSVDGVSQESFEKWPLAKGGIIQADGKGNITITSVATTPAPWRGKQLRLNFTDWANPKATVYP